MTAPQRERSDLAQAAQAVEHQRAQRTRRYATTPVGASAASTMGVGSTVGVDDVLAPRVYRQGEWRIDSGELCVRWHGSATSRWWPITPALVADRLREARMLPDGHSATPELAERLVAELEVLHAAAQAQRARIAATPRQDESEAFAKRVLHGHRVLRGSDGPRWEPWAAWQERQRSGATTTATPVRTSNSRLAAMLRGPAQPPSEPGEPLTFDSLKAYLLTSGVVQPYETCDDACVARVLDHLIAAAEAAPPTT